MANWYAPDSEHEWQDLGSEVGYEEIPTCAWVSRSQFEKDFSKVKADPSWPAVVIHFRRYAGHYWCYTEEMFVPE